MLSVVAILWLLGAGAVAGLVVGLILGGWPRELLKLVELLRADLIRSQWETYDADQARTESDQRYLDIVAYYELGDLTDSGEP